MACTTKYLFFILLLVSSSTHSVLGAKSDGVVKLLTVGSWGNVTTNARTRMLNFAVGWLNNNTNILPNARIELYVRNCGGGSVGNPAKCIVQTTLGLLESNYTGVLSGSYTADQRVIQFAASAFGLPQVGCFASGALMSNKHDYPTFLRTVPSDILTDVVMVNFIAAMGWKNVIIALEDGDWGAGHRDTLVNSALSKGINMNSIYCPTGQTDFTKQAEFIKSQNYSVIIIMLNGKEAYTLLDAANKTGIIGPNYVWLAPNTVVTSLGQLEVIKAEAPYLDPYALRKLMDGTIGFIARGGDGALYEELAPKYEAYYNSPSQAYYWYGFDAILAYAYAVEKFMARGIPVDQINSTELLDALLRTEFNGTTGYIYYDANYDRQGLINVHNIYKDTMTTASIFDPRTGNFTQFEPYHFFGGRTTVPVDIIEACDCGLGSCSSNFTCICPENYHGTHCTDYVPPPLRIEPFSITLSAGLGALVGIAVILSIFSVFALTRHWAAFAKHGSFYCALITVGTFFAYVAAAMLLPRQTNTLCLAFPWFLGIGFILTYGCLFIKTWVVFTAWHSATQYKKASITPRTIIIRIGMYLTVELIFLIIWSNVDPPTLRLRKMIDGAYMWQCECDTSTFWIVFTCAKGVWLISGVVFSILTRNISKEYNESKSIAYATYNNTLLVVIAVPLILTLRDIPNGALIIEVCVIVLAFGFTLFILFYPLWHEIFFTSTAIVDIKAAVNRSKNSSDGSRSSNSGYVP